MKKIIIASAALALGLSAATLDECQEKEQKYLHSVAKFNAADYNHKKDTIRSVKTNLDDLLKCNNVIDIAVYKKHAIKLHQLIARYK